jgi:hypothetical protein
VKDGLCIVLPSALIIIRQCGNPSTLSLSTARH